MPEPELFLLFVRPFNRAGIRYLMTGSVAAIFYGEPRLTHDVNFVVFLNRVDIQKLAGETISLAPPEYVIVRKLEYYREGRSEKHLRDIRSMLAISGEQLDRQALKDWVERRGVQAEWRLVAG